MSKRASPVWRADGRIAQRVSLHGGVGANYDDLASDLKQRGWTKADMQLFPMNARLSWLKTLA